MQTTNYPSMTDIQQAVQNPHVVFSDNILKQYNVQTNPLGLPKVLSGGFALTYCLQKGTDKVAVRCFHREVSDLQERYQVIGSFLKTVNSPYFVNFEYQAKGIRIKQGWYPIVKMDWLNGVSISAYVEDNLKNPIKLKGISEQLLHCSKHLNQLGMAHGDLQHGNILVVGDRIVLIDYDGAYVPNMSYTKSNEVGHKNYQHPGREAIHFNGKMDRFSFIVMYMALEALQVSPSLWKKYDNGENLLFRDKDFLNPDTSPLIQELQNIPSLKQKVAQFVKLCKLKSPDQVVSLEEFTSGNVSLNESDLFAGVRKSIFSQSVLYLNDVNAADRQVGNVVEMVGRVVRVHETQSRSGKDMAFIDFGHYKQRSFTIVIFENRLKTLKDKQHIEVKNLSGKWVSLTGLVEEFKGSPQIVLREHIKLNIWTEEEAKRMLHGTTQVAKGTSTSDISSSPQDILADILNLTNSPTHTNRSAAARQNPERSDGQSILNAIGKLVGDESMIKQSSSTSVNATVKKNHNLSSKVEEECDKLLKGIQEIRKESNKTKIQSITQTPSQRKNNTTSEVLKSYRRQKELMEEQNKKGTESISDVITTAVSQLFKNLFK